MNNYEKIMLALFAIQHNAYAFHNINEFLREYADSDFAKKRCEGRDELMGNVVAKLAEVMEMLGECLDATEGVTGLDAELMKIPYDIVYGRKTPEDYE